jgi:DNA-directed RNA polymerase specialized sigma24 family protein
VRAAALGDQQAWDRLVDKHSSVVWQQASGWTPQPDEARAVFELVWCRLAQVLPDLDGMALADWLAAQVHTEAGNARRRTGRAAGPVPHERRRQARAALA